MSATCSVKDKCGPTGKECRADDRECQNAAVKDGLEILCEDREAAIYVYCPAGTQARDSSVVWILLVVAILIAVVGVGILALAMRRAPKVSSSSERAPRQSPPP
jgi:hypothetical protein